MSGMEFTTSVMQVLVVAAGGALIMGGRMDYVDLVTFSLYVSTFVTPVRKLASFSEVYMQGTAGFSRFLELMRTEPDVQDAPDAIELKNVRGEVEYRDVSFSYNDEAGPVLEQESLRRSIGIIQQDVFIFAGTIRENIRYGRPDATDAEVVAAAVRAEIHQEIMAMPDGYDSYVGERGVMLSGGQKQRLSIARVFLNPGHGRGDQRAGYGHGAAHPGLSRRAGRGQDEHNNSAPALHDTRCGQDSGNRGRARPGAGHARGADGQKRRLCRPLPGTDIYGG